MLSLILHLALISVALQLVYIVNTFQDNITYEVGMAKSLCMWQASVNNALL